MSDFLKPTSSDMWPGPLTGCRDCEEKDAEIARLRADLDLCHVLRKTTWAMQEFISERGLNKEGDNMAEILMARIVELEDKARGGDDE